MANCAFTELGLPSPAPKASLQRNLPRYVASVLRIMNPFQEALNPMRMMDHETAEKLAES